MSAAVQRLWRLPLISLCINLSEARELAAVLEENVLDLKFDVAAQQLLEKRLLEIRSSTPQPRTTSFTDRLRSGVPVSIGGTAVAP